MTELLAPPLMMEGMKGISAGLTAPEARWLVDYYYATQGIRIQASGQARAIRQGADEGVDHIAIWLEDSFKLVEKNIQDGLGAYAMARVPGQWAMSQYGIGPVIAAGLLAHIDITQAPTVGHIWSFAGLDPTKTWGKGEKRPWNASLKTLCWKIGDSFVKFHNRENCIYGHVYAERKVQEIERNSQGLFADQAATTLATKNIRDKDTKATYEAGRLPDGRLDLRARRYAVKLFLAHLHHVMYEDHYGELPPKPYVISHLGHAHFLSPPNWPMV